MATVPYLYTEDDLEQAREATSDRLELLEGEIVVTPSPSPMHQDVLGFLYTLFRRVIRDTGQGRVYVAPLDVALAEYTIVQPDLVVLLPDRRSVVTEKRIEGTPSFVVEIISPTTGIRDRIDKRDIYAQYGVPEYWLVDALNGEVTVFADPRDGHYQIEHTSREVVRSATMLDIAATLAELFAPPPDL